GNVAVFDALIGIVRAAARRIGISRGDSPAMGPATPASLPERVAGALATYRGRVLIVLSGRDDTAAEFRLAAAKPGTLNHALAHSNARWIELSGADHTFSNERWRAEAAAATLRWLGAEYPGFVQAVADASAMKGVE